LILVREPGGSLTNIAFFQAKALQKCGFNKEVVQKLKFPNNSNAGLKILPVFADNE
jgi:hypothetical protein